MTDKIKSPYEVQKQALYAFILLAAIMMSVYFGVAGPALRAVVSAIPSEIPSGITLIGLVSLVISVIGLLAIVPYFLKLYLYYFHNPPIRITLPRPAEYSDEKERYEISSEYLTGPEFVYEDDPMEPSRTFPYSVRCTEGDIEYSAILEFVSEIPLNTKQRAAERVIQREVTKNQYCYEIEGRRLSKRNRIAQSDGDEVNEGEGTGSSTNNADGRGKKRPTKLTAIINASDIGMGSRQSTVRCPLDPRPVQTPFPNEYTLSLVVHPMVELSEFEWPLINQSFPRFYGSVELQPIEQPVTVLVHETMEDVY